MQDTWVRSLGWEDHMEKGISSHSSIFAWRIPWREMPGGLQSMGLQRVRNDWVTFTSLHFTYFPYSEAESQGPSCWVTFQRVHLTVFRVSVTSHVRGHVTAQEVWIWGVAFAFSSSLFWIMFLLLCFLCGPAGEEST